MKKHYEVGDIVYWDSNCPESKGVYVITRIVDSKTCRMTRYKDSVNTSLEINREKYIIPLCI